MPSCVGVSSSCLTGGPSERHSVGSANGGPAYWRVLGSGLHQHPQSVTSRKAFTCHRNRKGTGRGWGLQ